MAYSPLAPDHNGLAPAWTGLPDFLVKQVWASLIAIGILKPREDTLALLLVADDRLLEDLDLTRAELHGLWNSRH